MQFGTAAMRATIRRQVNVKLAKDHPVIVLLLVGSGGVLMTTRLSPLGLSLLTGPTDTLVTLPRPFNVILRVLLRLTPITPSISDDSHGRLVRKACEGEQATCANILFGCYLTNIHHHLVARVECRSLAFFTFDCRLSICDLPSIYTPLFCMLDPILSLGALFRLLLKLTLALWNI